MYDAEEALEEALKTAQAAYLAYLRRFAPQSTLG